MGGVGTSYIWHSTDVRAQWSPFFSAARYMISPFFQQKVYDLTSYIWHSTDVHAEWSPFFSAARYMISPLFSTKSIWLTRFSLICMWRAPDFWHPGICVFFFEAACSLGIQWTDCRICLTTSNKWVQKIKGQYMNRSTFRTIRSIWMGPFFRRPAIWMGLVSKYRLAHPYHNYPLVTPSPQTPPPPDPPPPPPHTHTRWKLIF